MQLKGYMIGEQGFYIEDYIYEENQELESNIIITEMPEGFYKPKWDGEKWIEGDTQEEIEKINYVPTPQPTPDEILRAKLLKDNVNIQLQLAQQQKINANLLTQISKLGGTQ
jgi:hypothetical protein